MPLTCTAATVIVAPFCENVFPAVPYNSKLPVLAIVVVGVSDTFPYIDMPPLPENPAMPAPVIVKLLHFAAPVLTKVTSAAVLNITLSVAVGTPALPAPPEDSDQGVVVVESHVPGEEATQ